MDLTHDFQEPLGFRVGKIDFADGQGSPWREYRTPTPPSRMSSRTRTLLPGARTGVFGPVGLAFDKKGRLFMTSDYTGELYVIGGGV
ncbi:hypothetical protein F5X96DRAFT_633694 [Biscogniauxia mediterranea]|nr:hypothetical protein F5X96DRAFT_633694 [Biscogniauxia mediterranea]